MFATPFRNCTDLSRRLRDGVFLSSLPPSHVAEWVSHDPGILELLVEPHLGESGGKALEVIVGAVGLVQTVPRSLVERVFQSQSNNHRLIDVVIRGAVLEFVRSGENPEILDAVVGHATFAEWLGGKNWKLTALVKGGVSDRDPVLAAGRSYTLSRIPRIDQKSLLARLNL